MKQSVSKALLTGLFCLIGILYTQTTNAQDNNLGRFRVAEFRGHTGSHLYSGQGLENYLENGYGSFELRYGWQTSDPQGWGAIYNYPSYGLGVYTGNIGNSEVFGNPNALYGWINFPLSRPGRRNVFSINTALGLTYNLEPFDPVNNPLNDAIGARMAVYFDLSFEFAYRLNREMDLIYGVDFAHFSNGRSFTPNYGLNMLGLVAGLKYNYNADQKKLDNDPFTDNLLQARFQRIKAAKPERIAENSINLYLAIGTAQNDEDAGTSNRYTIFSAVLDYEYTFNSMHAATAGLDYFYDPSLGAFYPDESEKWSLVAAHLGYDFRFWKFAVRLQAGAYITDDRGKGAMFLRPAIRYQITKWMHGQIGLKTKNGAAADWVEFGLAFKPFSW